MAKTYRKKEGGRWGFVIEEREEDLRRVPEEQNSSRSWSFKDAPRDLRLKVVERIPQLLEALVSKANEVASKVAEKAAFATELSAGLAEFSRAQGGKQ